MFMSIQDYLAQPDTLSFCMESSFPLLSRSCCNLRVGKEPEPDNKEQVFHSLRFVLYSTGGNCQNCEMNASAVLRTTCLFTPNGSTLEWDAKVSLYPSVMTNIGRKLT